MPGFHLASEQEIKVGAGRSGVYPEQRRRVPARGPVGRPAPTAADEGIHKCVLAAVRASSLS